MKKLFVSLIGGGFLAATLILFGYLLECEPNNYSIVVISGLCCLLVRIGVNRIA